MIRRVLRICYIKRRNGIRRRRTYKRLYEVCVLGRPGPREHDVDHEVARSEAEVGRSPHHL